MRPASLGRRRAPVTRPAGKFGFAPDEWRAARAALEAVVERAAAMRSTVTYGEAARAAFGSPSMARSGALMALLAEADTAHRQREGVFIATLVVRADSGRPGDGYFAFAERTEGRLLTPDEREAYWVEQAERVWSRYGSQGRP